MQIFSREIFQFSKVDQLQIIVIAHQTSPRKVFSLFSSKLFRSRFEAGEHFPRLFTSQLTDIENRNDDENRWTRSKHERCCQEKRLNGLIMWVVLRFCHTSFKPFKPSIPSFYFYKASLHVVQLQDCQKSYSIDIKHSSVTFSPDGSLQEKIKSLLNSKIFWRAETNVW